MNAKLFNLNNILNQSNNALFGIINIIQQISNNYTDPILRNRLSNVISQLSAIINENKKNILLTLNIIKDVQNQLASSQQQMNLKGNMNQININ